MKQKLILFLSMLLMSVSLKAQKENMQRVNIKTPEVEAMMRMGETPVSLYTGTPQISIPIYTVQCGDLALPITLDYEGRAIKVNQEATWVGLNWSLNAGGMVTTKKSVYKSGLDDDFEFLYESLSMSNMYSDEFGRYYKVNGNHDLNMLGSHGYNAFTCIALPRTTDISHPLYGHLLNDHAGEAQRYQANFMGHSFEFIFHPIEKRFIVIGQDRKMEIVGGETGISKIIDADGIEYTFGLIENNNPNAYNAINTNLPLNQTYHLTRIKHPNGREVTLNYRQYDVVTLLPEMSETWYHGHPSKPDDIVERELAPVHKIYNYYLYEVKTENETVRFNVGTRTDLEGGRKLESIEIEDAQGDLLKRFDFSYSYMEGNTTGGNRLYDYYEKRNAVSSYNSLYEHSHIYQRLMLDSMQEVGFDSEGEEESLPPYRFSYHSGLPCKSSSARDYWGYYNGMDNTTLITDESLSGEDNYNVYPNTSNVTKADRSFNPSTVQCGMLNRILYPTGGSTSFEYEPHSFTNRFYFAKGESMDNLDVSTMATNANETVPESYREPHDFSFSRPREVELSIHARCNEPHHWREMLGNPTMIMEYKTIYTYDGPVTTCTPIKTFTINASDTLNTSEDGCELDLVYRFTLPKGDYQLRISSSMAQITPDASFTGGCIITSRLKTTSNNVSIGGGVRIKKITQSDGSGQSVVTSYDYATGTGLSTGLLMSPVRFAREMMLHYQANKESGATTVPPPVLKRYWKMVSENMVVPAGVTVGYSKVKVIRENGSEQYEYWNNAPQTYGTFTFYPPLEDPRNGMLKVHSLYDTSNNLVKEEMNTYSVLAHEDYFVNALVEDIYSGPDGCDTSTAIPQNLYAESTNGRRMLFCIYPSSKFWIECTQRLVNDYTPQGVVSTRTVYTYNSNNLQLKTEEVFHTDNVSRKRYILYPQDYAVGNLYRDSLVEKHMLNLPVEVVTTMKRANTENVVSGELYKYNRSGLLASHASLKLSEPLAISNFGFSNSATPCNHYHEHTVYGYTSFGNIASITMNNTDYTCYLWSYGKQHPLAVFKGISYNNLLSAIGYSTGGVKALEENLSPNLSLLGSSFTSSLSGRDVLMTLYGYRAPIGLTSVIESNGHRYDYHYDVFGRLDKVSENGMAVEQYAYDYANHNQIRERQLLNSSGSNYIDHLRHHDGMGRPVLSVDKAVVSGNAVERMATLQEYDAAGRDSNQWLPIRVTADYADAESFKSLAKGSSGYSNTHPYGKTVYEDSPLSRVVESYGAGSEWHNSGKSVKSAYLSNSASGTFSCKDYRVGSNGELVSDGNHAAQTLHVVQTTDEDGHIRYEFSDKDGKVLLQRSMNGTEQTDTYFVYDDLGNLRYVLQPMYQTEADLDKYAFCYSYDERGRQTSKQLPGTEPVVYEYDTADRLIYSQDGKQRVGNKWTYYLYDNLSRITEQGECTAKSANTRTAHVKNHYDDYSFIGTGSFATGYTAGNASCAKGKLTGTEVTLFGSTGEECSVYHYNAKGEVIKHVCNNQLGGYETETTNYSFSGQPATITRTHTASGKPSITNVLTYSYDHFDRLSKVTHRLNNGAEVILSEYSYNGLGQLSGKSYHNASADSLYYTYNVRGWLTGIYGEKFVEGVNYSGLYNGNIRSINWGTLTNRQSYTYIYDGLNRLTEAIHSGNRFNEKVTEYDKNGNIKKLQRYGQTGASSYGLVDNLTYTYNGNKLTRVDDAVTATSYTGGTNFINGANTSNEYVYDQNGNLTKDLNKNISNIQYNSLNLPSVVTFSDGSTITYTYTHDGKKLRTVHVIGGVTTTTDYCGNVIYENGTAKRLLNDEGYVDLTTATPTYYYYLKDHQGNNRVVINSSGTVQETNHYYPFGGLFAANGSVQDYKYNGKELDDKTKWYDYGARHYDAALGRFTTQDRFAEKYSALSTYQYGANSPVCNIDINGDSLKIVSSDLITAIYHGLKDGSRIQMKFNNGILDPASIKDSAMETDDLFLQDLYEIAINSQMVEMYLDSKNTYLLNGIPHSETFSAPYDDNDDVLTDAMKRDLELMGIPTGKHVNGNLGQTLVPNVLLPSGKNSTNNNVQIIINSKGNLNHRAIGIAHEFGHVILYLRNQPFSHGQPGVNSFIDRRSSIMSKRLGYDY